MPEQMDVQLALIALAVALVEALKALIRKVRVKHTVEEAIITPEALAILLAVPTQLRELVDFVNRQQKKVDELHDWHNVRDPEGLPIWYTPRSWGREYQQITKELAATQATIRDMQHTLIQILRNQDAPR